jgi:hypothetical protein
MCVGFVIYSLDLLHQWDLNVLTLVEQFHKVCPVRGHCSLLSARVHASPNLLLISHIMDDSDDWTKLHVIRVFMEKEICNTHSPSASLLIIYKNISKSYLDGSYLFEEYSQRRLAQW